MQPFITVVFPYFVLSSSVVQARTPKSSKAGREEDEAMDTTAQGDSHLSAERYVDCFKLR